MANNSLQNILVVGGAGYIGGAVTDLLLQHPDLYNVRVYDNLLYEDNYYKPVDFVFGDVRDVENLKRELDWADVVIWLAGIVGDAACEQNKELAKQINLDSVEWLKDNFNKRIIFASTCSVYGAQNELLTEESPFNPLSLYAEQKVKAEGILANKDAIICRFGTVFGVSDDFSRIRLDLVVNILTMRAHTSGKINIFGGEQYRPLIHVRDAARALVLGISHPTTSPAAIYNIAYKNLKMVDLANDVKRHFPNVIVEMTDMPFQDTRNYRVVMDKAERGLGFKAQYSIDDGVKQMLDLIKNKRIKNLAHSRHVNHLHLKFLADQQML